MTDELDKALEWADWINGVGYEVPKIISAKKGAEILAIAVRSLRETVKARDEEIAAINIDLRNALLDVAALKHRLGWPKDKPRLDANPSLDQALNEGDGSYKP